jgi:hypothetical protein
MEEVQITLPRTLAESLHAFISANLNSQGSEGAQAVLTIVAAFESALKSGTEETELPSEPAGKDKK